MVERRVQIPRKTMSSEVESIRQQKPTGKQMPQQSLKKPAGSKVIDILVYHASPDNDFILTLVTVFKKHFFFLLGQTVVTGF